MQVDSCEPHLVRVVQIHDLSHVITRGKKPLDVSMVRPHPQLLQQVDVILLLLDKFPYSLHPRRLVLGTKSCRHAPRVQGHQLEADYWSKPTRGGKEVGDDEGGDEAQGAQEQQAQAADCCSS